MKKMFAFTDDGFSCNLVNSNIEIPNAKGDFKPTNEIINLKN